MGMHPKGAPIQGILPVKKPRGKNSFWLVAVLRRHLGVKKIGHAGTLDPFATGVMVMLIGKTYTKLSDRFLGQEKEYRARVRLGVATDTYDCDGQVTMQSEAIPSLEQVTDCLTFYQGEIDQIPPMFSAKKRQGKKLYELARCGIEVPREPVKVTLTTSLLGYAYPYLDLNIACSKGTYIRSVAHDLGQWLGCGGYLTDLLRTRSGGFHLDNCFDGEEFNSPGFSPADLGPWLLTEQDQ